MANKPKNNDEYITWVVELKKLISTAQIKASLSVNREMLFLYWEIGKSISYKVEFVQQLVGQTPWSKITKRIG